MHITGHIEYEIKNQTFQQLNEILGGIWFEDDIEYKTYECGIVEYIHNVVMSELISIYSSQFILTITITEKSIVVHLTYGNILDTENLINRLRSITHNEIKSVVIDLYNFRELLYQRIINSEINTIKAYFNIITEIL